MAMIVYVFAALAMVIFVGWAVYVLPTPGPLGPMQLAIAMLPALTLLGTVLLGLAALWLLAAAGLWLWRRLRRWLAR